MDAYFVRVYTMRDGSKHEVYVGYRTYEEAMVDLNRFNPSGEGVDDMENVLYAQVEKRFSPTPYWTD